MQGFEKVNNSLQEQKGRAAHSVGPCEVCNMAVQRPATRCAEHEHSPLAPAPRAPIVIELAGEPRGKGRPRSRIVKKGKAAFVQTYSPPETRSYEGMLRHEAVLAMRGRALLVGPLRLHIEVFLSIPASWSAKRKRQAATEMILPTTKPDFDNCQKVLDALNKVVWRDDAQITDWSGTKRYSERPRLVVTVEALVS